MRGKGDMSFWDHLDELRKVLFRSIGAIALFLVVIFPSKKFIFEKIIFAPIDEQFILYRWFDSLASFIGVSAMSPEPFNIKLINIELATQFFTHISVSITFAFICAVPYILYQFWGFVSPGLYPKERAAAERAFGFASILFFVGVLVGYIFVFPLTLRFLGTYQVSGMVENQISLRSYISMFTSLILVMGVVFELPALALILSRLGILSKSTLKEYRRHAFLGLMIAAAFITPSGDAFTLMIVGTPLYLLYEFSILICRDFDK